MTRNEGANAEKSGKGRSKGRKPKQDRVGKAKRRRNDLPQRSFIMDGEGKVHYTRRPLGHLASELADTGRMDEAANLVRGLRPWAQRSTIGGEVVVDRHDHKEGTGLPPGARFRPSEVVEAIANRSAI